MGGSEGAVSNVENSFINIVPVMLIVIGIIAVFVINKQVTDIQIVNENVVFTYFNGKSVRAKTYDIVRITPAGLGLRYMVYFKDGSSLSIGLNERDREYNEKINAQIVSLKKACNIL